METITTTETMREHLGDEPDRLNMFLATACDAFGPDDDEVAHLAYADRLQVEGFVLHPRHGIAIPVEIVTYDSDEADYILRQIRDSQIHLAGRQAQGIALGASRFGFNGTPMTFTGLGEALDAQEAE